MYFKFLPILGRFGPNGLIFHDTFQFHKTHLFYAGYEPHRCENVR